MLSNRRLLPLSALAAPLAVVAVAAAAIAVPASAGPASDGRLVRTAAAGPQVPVTAPVLRRIVQATELRGVVCRHLPDGLDVCTHGDDAQLATAAGESGTASSSTSTRIGCYGKGTDGSRVQAVYARRVGSADRYNELLPSFRRWAGTVDLAFDRSAQQTGGHRHVRFATSPPGGDTGCGLSVLRLVLDASAFSSFDHTIDAVRSKGLNLPGVKYLVWADADALCGLASAYGDKTAGPDNANNGAYPTYARVDRRCWGSAEAHEVMHMLGAVQPDAPHATAGFHCNDGADLMCYADGTARSAQHSVCGSAQAQLFDCRHDDYFSTSPPRASYLSTHWNTAASAFLAAAWSDPPPATSSPEPEPQDTPPPATTVLPSLPPLPPLPGGGALSDAVGAAVRR